MLASLGDGVPRLPLRAAARAQPARGGGDRRHQPDRARLGAGRRPQRLPDAVLPRARRSGCCCGPTRCASASARARPAARRPACWRRCAAAWAWLDGMPRPLVDGEPAAWMEVGAGIALVAAVAIKASARRADPDRAVRRRAAHARRARAADRLRGRRRDDHRTRSALNLPNIGQQDRLVIPDGIPNLTGYALGLRRRDGPDAQRAHRCCWSP